MAYSGNFKLKQLVNGYSDNRFMGTFVNTSQNIETPHIITNDVNGPLLGPGTAIFSGVYLSGINSATSLATNSSGKIIAGSGGGSTFSTITAGTGLFNKIIAGTGTFSNAIVFSTTGATITSDTIDPNGVVTAVAGSLFIRTGGSPGLYLNSDGSTGWVVFPN